MLPSQIPVPLINHEPPRYPVTRRSHTMQPLTLDPREWLLDLGATAPEWPLPPSLTVMGNGALVKALTSWRQHPTERLRRLLYALLQDESIKWRADELLRLPAGSGPQRKLVAALEAVRKAGYRRVSLEGMAAAACVTPFHFTRLFKAAVGAPPGQFMKRCQLLQGIDLLAGGSTTISQIAHELDMDRSYFSTQCRQHYGLSPRELRCLLTAG